MVVIKGSTAKSQLTLTLSHRAALHSISDISAESGMHHLTLSATLSANGITEFPSVGISLGRVPYAIISVSLYSSHPRSTLTTYDSSTHR